MNASSCLMQMCLGLWVSKARFCFDADGAACQCRSCMQRWNPPQQRPRDERGPLKPPCRVFFPRLSELVEPWEFRRRMRSDAASGSVGVACCPPGRNRFPGLFSHTLEGCFRCRDGNARSTRTRVECGVQPVGGFLRPGVSRWTYMTLRVFTGRALGTLGAPNSVPSADALHSAPAQHADLV